jgi:hypothetical protein
VNQRGRHINHQFPPELLHHFGPKLELDNPQDESAVPMSGWAAARSSLPSVTIGSYSIIGAGSVVTRDVPVGVFAAGNPCRL